jgi:glycerol-3-phosphate acyltransferase PlsY
VLDLNWILESLKVTAGINYYALIVWIILLIIIYLIGSIPFGYILVRLFKKQDIRTTGSGNIGATNVARTAPALGIVTLILDVLKGALPVWLLSWYALNDVWDIDEGALMVSLVALLAILGHIFPVWLKFRGGKGVATAAGVFLVLSPKAFGLSLLVFLLVFALSRYVSLASILSAACFPLFAYYFEKSALWQTRSLLVSSIIIAALIIVKHHENIRRLLNGTENKFGKKKKAEVTTPEDCGPGTED